MAVKVMVAPAIARGELSPPQAPRRGAGAAGDGDKKPRRRRSSVYDAEGNEVFITLMCLKCHKMRPLSQFGLRRMADGAIRNQPWCRSCRGAATPKRRPEHAEATAPATEPAQPLPEAPDAVAASARLVPISGGEG